MGSRWMNDRKREYYYRKAKEEQYRSRAAYKLKQVNKRFGLIKQGDKVLDLGAAPGGWMQVLREIVGDNGFVLGVDLEEIKPFEYENIKSIQGDFTSEGVLEEIKKALPEVDVIISDASPSISGVWTIDHLKSVELCERVLEIAEGTLKPKGNMLLKIFQGEETRRFFESVAKRFSRVKRTKPEASRGKSAEMYIVAKGKIA
ncbi:MAG: SAM-dependent methyltransferase [Candidatus Hydrothermarchaeales archaeon]